MRDTESVIIARPVVNVIYILIDINRFTSHLNNALTRGYLSWAVEFFIVHHLSFLGEQI